MLVLLRRFVMLVLEFRISPVLSYVDKCSLSLRACGMAQVDIPGLTNLRPVQEMFAAWPIACPTQCHRLSVYGHITESGSVCLWTCIRAYRLQK